MSVREMRGTGPVDLLDEAIRTARTLGARSALRAWAAAALPGAALIVLFYFERVESLRTARLGFAFVLVVTWCLRALLLKKVAADAVALLSPEMKRSRQTAGNTVLAALVFGIGLWFWLWPLVFMSWVEPPLAFLLLPLLAGRGALAPSWIARTGVLDESGIATWLGAFRDSARKRATGAFAELFVYFGALGLFVNFFLLLRFFVYAGRAYFGFDLAMVESFFSGRNDFMMIVLACGTLILLEPLRVSLSCVHFVAARALSEGLDLTANIDAAVQHTTKKTALSQGTLVVVALSILAGLSGAARAQDFPKTNPADAEARTSAGIILSQPEYREFADAPRDHVEPGESWWDRLMRWLNQGDHETASGGGGLPGAGLGLPSAQIFIVLGVILLLIVSLALVLARSRKKELSEEVAADVATAPDIREKAPTVFLDEAAQLAARGLYREALRSLYLATLVALDRRRLISFDPHLTNWQYMRQMPRNEARDLFGTFTRVFDWKWYGNEATTEEDYVRCRSLADRICAPATERAT